MRVSAVGSLRRQGLGAQGARSVTRATVHVDYSNRSF